MILASVIMYIYIYIYRYLVIYKSMVVLQLRIQPLQTLDIISKLLEVG